jgi:hypothetical protein
MKKEKECSGCKTTKLISEFYAKTGRVNGHPLCKNCFNQYCMKRWKARKVEAISYKNNICLDCKITYPEFPSDVFEFHHLDPNEKDFEWTKLKLRSKEDINKELDKCVMLCANCHRVRHYKENLL